MAEGFNVDPESGRGVFDGAFAYLSGGNWLAINRWGDDGEPQAPYARPFGVPVPAADLLTRPGSDPFLVEISSYTDYYRLRASRSADAPVPARARHYDFPSPHAPGTLVPPDAVFGLLGCNGGHEVPMNPIGAAPAIRATLLGLFRELGASTLPAGVPALPPSVYFALGPAPPASEHFNALPGVELRVPLVDDDAQPVGGVRLPEVELPLGRAEPVALAPCGTASIDDVCGNFGGWQPFTADELVARYGTIDDFRSRYASAYDALVEEGFALAAERAVAVERAAAGYEAAISSPLSRSRTHWMLLGFSISPSQPASSWSTRRGSGITPRMSTVTSSVGRSGTRVSPTGSMNTGSAGLGHGVELAGGGDPRQLGAHAVGIGPLAAELDLLRLAPAGIGVVELFDVHGHLRVSPTRAGASARHSARGKSVCSAPVYAWTHTWSAPASKWACTRATIVASSPHTTTWSIEAVAAAVGEVVLGEPEPPPVVHVVRELQVDAEAFAGDGAGRRGIGLEHDVLLGQRASGPRRASSRAVCVCSGVTR